MKATEKERPTCTAPAVDFEFCIEELLCFVRFSLHTLHNADGNIKEAQSICIPHCGKGFLGKHSHQI